MRGRYALGTEVLHGGVLADAELEVNVGGNERSQARLHLDIEHPRGLKGALHILHGHGPACRVTHAGSHSECEWGLR